MKIHDIKLSAKKVLHYQWGPLLLALVLESVVLTCGNVIPVAGTLLLSGPVAVGLNIIYYVASQQRKVNLWDLFKGFEINFGGAFLLSILRPLFIFLWSLLFIIPGIIKRYAYAMAYYIMMREEDITAQDALKKSRDMMKGYKWKLFILNLSFIGWNILTVLTFGILQIYVDPLYHSARTEFFNRVYAAKQTPAIDTSDPA